MTVRVGLLVDMRNPPAWQRPWHSHYEEVLERIKEADWLGLDSVWLTEHHMWEDGYLPQPLVFAAAIAARTQRIRIGTAVLAAPIRPAIDIAEQAALVDILSNGRLELGLGAGYVASEFQAYGADRTRRVKLLEERALEVLRLWREGVVVPPPVQVPPPLWIGALGPRVASFAGRIGAGLLSLDSKLIDIYQTELAAAGHSITPPRYAATARFILADDPEEAWTRIKPNLKWMVETYARAAMDGGDPSLTSKYDTMDVDPDLLRMRTGVPEPISSHLDVVTAEEAVARLTPWLAERPGAHLMFWASIAGMPSDLADRHMQLLATKLAPALRALFPG